MNPIIGTLLPIIKMFLPTLSPVIDDIQKAIAAGTLTFENAEALAQHLLMVGETYLPKDAQILADIANIIPQVAKLITDIQNAK